MRAYEIIPGTTVESIRLTERPAPVARAGQVVIDIRACSLNFRDVINISGPQDGSPKVTGVVPLSDGAGVVTAVGEGVTRLKVGDRVAGAFMPDWISGPMTPEVQAGALGGTVDGATMNTNLLVGNIKDAGLVDLPYLFDSEQEAYAVLDGPFGKKLHALLEPKGLIGLSYFDMGYYSLHNGKHPITKVEDVAGLKMRVTETPVTIDTFKAFGATAVPLPYVELYSALEEKSSMAADSLR